MMITKEIGVKTGEQQKDLATLANECVEILSTSNLTEDERAAMGKLIERMSNDSSILSLKDRITWMNSTARLLKQKIEERNK